MSVGQRTTFYPKQYRVIVSTVAGPIAIDRTTLADAEKVREANIAPGWPTPRILACWHVPGRVGWDTEEVR